MPAISLWRFREASRRGAAKSGHGSGASCDRGCSGTRSFGHLDRGQELLDVREVFVERLGQCLPGELEHRLSRIDGATLDIFDATIGRPVGEGGGQSEEPGHPSHVFGYWVRPVGELDDLRDTLALADLLLGSSKAGRGVALETI